MKKLVLLLFLLASCRTTRVVESTVSHRDTIVCEAVAASEVLTRDTDALTRSTDACVERISLDTSGRVRTVTRIITRTVTEASHAGSSTTVARDTVFVTRSSTGSGHTTRAPSHSTRSYLPLFAIFLIFVFLLLVVRR